MPECYGETFNIGADRPYTVMELAQEVARALGVEPKIVHLPPRSEVIHAYASHAKVESFFGPQPKTDLRDGLRAMVSWAKRTGMREPVPFQSIEVHKNLPDSWKSTSSS